ncbi:MAG TPA: right-handed parallel beta-helix repeat-containing protein, partial [Pirellulaceae bacterium]|nr:right-handed parallel beta-helix repeat-containing protein [Pirellulaceae bacterium]
SGGGGTDTVTGTGRGAGELVSRDAFLQFTPAIAGDYYVGVSGANGTPVAAPFTVYNPTIEGSNDTGSTGFYELNLTFGDPARASSQTFTDSGDQNRLREQGQILLQGNRISSSAQFGIVSTAAGTDPLSGEAHQGPVRQLRELNYANLAPGVVISNNLLVSNLQGGIHFSGDSVTANAPAPFGRIINNTVWGNGGTLASGAGRGDTGILVDNNSSPTLLNNVLVNLTTGIQVAANSSTTVVGGSVYQGNRGNTNGVSVEDFPIVLPDTTQLFVNPLLGNFYPAKGSPIIDSSIDSLLERASLETVKAPLGIAPSPILAPERDLYGLLRVDDPNSSSPIGFGENVFKDRGAIDRADFSGSVAQLINPRDEVFTGVPPLTTAATDRNGAAAFVQLSNTPLYDFSIQLIDGVEPADPVNGIGVDDTTVTKEKVFVQRDTQLLQEGTDYKFVYDSTNNIIRIVPLAGVWDLDRVYTLDLVNRDQFAFTAPSGNQVTEGQTFTVGDGVTTQTFEFDSGYVMQVPAAGVADGQRFTIVNGLNPPVTFEFDRNGVSTAGNVRISFTSTSTQNDIANLIVSAIRGVTGLGLSPVNVANGQVWIGGTTNHSIDVRQSNLQVTGQPGAQTAGAIPVPFIPGFVPTTTAGATPTTPAMPADLLANSITTTIQSSGLSGVRATWRSYTVGTTQTVEVDVRGAATVTGFTTTFTPAIRDLAGNDLKANLATGETTFTIFLGNGLDYGDAPTPYPTATSGAASHGIVNGFFLGSVVDAEPNGQPTIGADGDDVNGLPDDEDGITFNSPVAQAGTVTITVTAASPGGTNGQPAGFLDAFIDFNRDGDWDDPSDRIFASRQLVVGANTLTFNVPGNASIGSTYARFRYSSTGALTSSGAASDGEVEDYQ